MPFLIDGYNLLFALGQLTPRSQRPAFESARRWLAQRVRLAHGPRADVTIVFDGAGFLGTARSRSSGGGLCEFSRGESADDRIEERIRVESSPRFLIVVSDDHRLHQAARRRGCQVLGCLDYAEQHLLATGDAATTVSVPESPPAKPDTVSPEEAEHWLDAFGDVGEDPLLRDPY